jgi:Zn finger protein HypA/HybF involved in hydrogenase expression
MHVVCVQLNLDDIMIESIMMSSEICVRLRPGKSECTGCGSATGRFCRACLLVRYGMQLEDVRAEMEAGTWLCPHCYEDDHPEEARSTHLPPHAVLVRLTCRTIKCG